MKRSYIAGNWKMNTTLSESLALAKGVAAKLAQGKHRYLVAPPYTALASVAQALKGTNIEVAAQNVSELEQGARTGEISVLMLKDLGIKNVIIGHSERRQFFGETDAQINAKIKLALKHGLSVIFCNGETLAEREAGKAVEVVDRQTRLGLEGISAADLAKVTVAYEPVWAIGTGKTASPDQANDMHKAIRATIAALYDDKLAKTVSIQYGGSVKPDNAKALLGMSDIDGALVGGASLKVEDFTAIAQFDM